MAQCLQQAFFLTSTDAFNHMAQCLQLMNLLI